MRLPSATKTMVVAWYVTRLRKAVYAVVVSVKNVIGTTHMTEPIFSRQTKIERDGVASPRNTSLIVRNTQWRGFTKKLSKQYFAL